MKKGRLRFESFGESACTTENFQSHYRLTLAAFYDWKYRDFAEQLQNVWLISLSQLSFTQKGKQQLMVKLYFIRYQYSLHFALVILFSLLIDTDAKLHKVKARKKLRIVGGQWDYCCLLCASSTDKSHDLGVQR